MEIILASNQLLTTTHLVSAHSDILSILRLAVTYANSYAGRAERSGLLATSVRVCTITSRMNA
jgi:hypothetical protein